ncbi:ferredoxin--NADP reductase [Reichenbachiella sp. MALMAid0571]|uniref:ferredoxin--NADP reductase n=1 Tax=Reichenbachiella sp. MALMAid0571 TaxID=3143939 RepID=UPI0032DED069
MAFGLFKKKKKKENTDSRFLNLTIKEVVKETEDAVSLVFEEPESGKLSYKPGQFITLIATINGKKVRRAYSLCSSPFLNENPAVTVKRVEDGVMSNFINNTLKAGDQIEIMEPMGSFTPEIIPANKRHIFLIGGGSGVTPLLSIAKSILSEEKESKVSLIYANRDESSIIFNATIANLQEQYPDNFNVVHFLENPPATWTNYIGWLDTAKLRTVFSSLDDTSYSDVSYYTCGPEPMMNIVMDTLSQMNVPDDKKHKESFVAGNTSPKDIIADENQSIEEQEVTVILDGEEHKYMVSPKSTILESGLDQNLDMPYSCQSGLCTACRGKCLSGKIKMDEEDGLSEEEKAEGYVLLCVGHPMTDDVVVEIG